MKATMMAAAVGVVGLLAAPSGASADTHWVINATFTDGATLSGYIDFNTYGYIGAYDLTTSPGGPFAGFDFTPGGGNIEGTGGGPGTQEVTLLGPTYDGDQLTLITSKSFTTESSGNTLLATSFECQNSGGCPTSGDVRYLGGASLLGTPEPATWALMIIGLGGVGVAARRRRSHVAA